MSNPKEKLASVVLEPGLTRRQLAKLDQKPNELAQDVIAAAKEDGRIKQK